VAETPGPALLYFHSTAETATKENIKQKSESRTQQQTISSGGLERGESYKLRENGVIWQFKGPDSRSLHQKSYLDLQILPSPHPYWRRNTRLSMDIIPEAGIQLHCHLVDRKTWTLGVGEEGNTCLEEHKKTLNVYVKLFLSVKFGMYRFPICMFVCSFAIHLN
jgi:hypothetical protein